MNSPVLPIKRFMSKATYEIANGLGKNNGISSLCYHSISDSNSPYAVSLSTCKEQLEKVRNHAAFIGSRQIKAMLEGQKTILAPAVLLTIDDGYKDVLSLLPYATKHGIKPIIFVLSHPQLANRKELGTSSPLLSWSDIHKLAKHGWTIGCHSATHADLTKIHDRELLFEIITSKRTLEKKLGIKIEYFAYPKGLYTDKAVEYVKKAGYMAAFGIQPGCITSKSQRYMLPRTIIKKSHEVSEFPAVYSPSTYFGREVLNHLPLKKYIHL